MTTNIFRDDFRDAVLQATDKLEVLEEVNTEALRAAVRALQAGFLDNGHYVLLRIAENLRKELVKLESVK